MEDEIPEYHRRQPAGNPVYLTVYAEFSPSNSEFIMISMQVGTVVLGGLFICRWHGS